MSPAFPVYQKRSFFLVVRVVLFISLQQRGSIAAHLFGSVGEVGNEILAVLLLLQATESHLGSGDVLLGVLEVSEEGVIVPGDALLLVGVGVGVAIDGSGLAAEKTVQGRTDLVGTALLDSVALGATGLEEVGTLLSVSCKAIVSKGVFLIGRSCVR